MKMMKKTSYLLVAALALFMLSACTLKSTPEEPTPTEVDPVAIFTSAAVTVEAELTQTALSFSPTSPPASATATLIPPTATLVNLNASPVASLPAVTQPVGVVPTLGIGTPSLVPTATLALNSTPSGPICDDMTYGDPVDVNYPDYTEVPAGTDFQKIWRVYNTGVCTWDDGYKLVPVSSSSTRSGDNNPLDAANPAWEFNKKNRITAPGEVADIGVNLTAPITNGEYMTTFILQNDRGVYFGGPLTVIIKVTDGK